jgi:hypothetical protein
MCEHCHLPAGPQETRRSFVRKMAAATVAAGLFGATRSRAQTAAPAIAGANWARLITSAPYWHLHRENDPHIVDFVREKTKLEISGHSEVRASRLDELCASRFLHTNNLAAVRDPHELLNLREYLFRGGFIYVDTCVRADVTPNFGRYYLEHRTLFQHLVPEAQVLCLPSDDPIFRAYFPVQIPAGKHPANDPQWSGLDESLYGVFDDDRMIALLSLAHLFCGWPDNPGKQPRALRQITNIYGYAMTH